MPKIDIPKFNIPESLKRKRKPISKKKKAALIALAAIILLAAGGYFGYIKYVEHNQKLIVEQAMKSKYGRHFEILGTDTIDSERFIAYLGVGEIEGAVVKAEVAGEGTSIKDNYVAARLCHEITDGITDKLETQDGLFIHTDNALEYTDAGSFDPDTVTRQEYLSEQQDDEFNVSVIINEDVADPASLRNTLGALAYSLDVEKGSFNVYAANEEAFLDLTENISHYDSMQREEIKNALEDAGGSLLSLNFSEINPGAFEALQQAEDAPTQEDIINAKNQNNRKN